MIIALDKQHAVRRYLRNIPRIMCDVTSLYHALTLIEKKKEDIIEVQTDTRIF